MIFARTSAKISFGSADHNLIIASSLIVCTSMSNVVVSKLAKRSTENKDCIMRKLTSASFMQGAIARARCACRWSC